MISSGVPGASLHAVGRPCFESRAQVRPHSAPVTIATSSAPRWMSRKVLLTAVCT